MLQSMGSQRVGHNLAIEQQHIRHPIYFPFHQIGLFGLTHVVVQVSYF